MTRSPAAVLFENLPADTFGALLTLGQLKEVGIAAAALLTLFGVRLCWHAPRQRMSIEERAKDGKISADQARRKIQQLGWTGPFIVVAGMGFLCGVLLR